MEQKNTNSKWYQEKQKKQKSSKNEEDSGSERSQNKDDDEENLEDFRSDEEHENFDSQKEDMKAYLSNLNKRIDTLVEALKQADQMMAKMGNQKEIIDQINSKKNGQNKKGVGSKEKQSIAEFFKQAINKK
jgi:hypothetical protein